MLESERSLYEARVKKFLARLENSLCPDKRDLELEYRRTSEPVPFADRLDGRYEKIRIGDLWGTTWQSAWFHLKGRVPEEWEGLRVVAILNFTGEACVFSEKGVPLSGLTGTSVFQPGFKRDRYDLFSRCRGGEAVDLWVEAAANGLFGVIRDADPPRDHPDRHGRFEAHVRDASLSIFREDIWALLMDCSVLADLMMAMPEKSVRRSRILRKVNEAIDIYRGDRANVEECRRIMAPELARPAHASDLSTLAVGHAHIDTGWLWPVRETIRKCARTFSSQIALMEKYPDLVFGASQAQHYAFVKEHYPGLYRKIREKAASGQWEIQGAMWVEADNNLISGESLVRQVLHGKNFFMDEFSVDVRNLWLPDVFGYSAALPQILRKAGVDYFVTQKISWSQFNKFPHHTFLWRGIDGSEVIAHFPPEDTYNSELRPKGLVYAQENFAERGFLDEFLTLFGAGDGGGGPKEEYIEMGLRQADLEGAPRVVFGPAQAMLDRLGEQRDRLETWVGELYLELHRGTLTTHAKNKKMNRRLEGRLRQVEILFSCLPLNRYPASELDRLWKQLLINQFHDILPGSSIHRVYEDSLAEYAEMDKALDRLTGEAAKDLFPPKSGSAVALNTLSFSYSWPFAVPASWKGHEVLDEEGRPVEVQETAEGPVVQMEIPPLSHRTLSRGKPADGPKPQEGQDLVLENALIRYEFDDRGRLLTAWDKEADREVLSKPGNLLNLYEDEPANWDAWDIDLFYENQLHREAAAGSHRSSKGPLMQVLELELRIGESKLHQRIVLSRHSKRLDFATRVEWRERHKMLRVGFHAAVHSELARFDTQFGTIERTTHRNTLWDRARFEVCGHRFADLSEPGYGVALLNDCKYGYKVHDRELNLNLLRSTTSPDPDADIGSHSFVYSLLPHRGSLVESGVWREAAQLNRPVELFADVEVGDSGLPVSLLGEGVVLEALKKAEREDCLVLRAYETRGCPAAAVLRLEGTGLSVFETDLMERSETEITLAGSEGEVSFAPFEIRTFKLKGLP